MEKPTKYFYRILIEKLAGKPLKSQTKWKLFLGKEVSEEEWENAYSSTFYLLNDIQLQSFQFKINHRIIFTNHLLMKCKLSETALCTFCNGAIEKIEHLFWECQYAKNIWISLALYLQKSLNLKLDMQGRIQDFKLGGGALKKIASSGGRREKFWGISCEKTRLYAKKSYSFQLRREARKILGYFV